MVSHHPFPSAPHALDALKVVRLFGSSVRGLSSSEVKRRQHRFGANELPQEAVEPAWRVLLDQFNNPLIWLLAVAIALSLILGERLEAGAMSVIMFITAILGFIQEYQASRVMEALRHSQARFARVIRDGILVQVPAEDVVPGDVLVVSAGDIIPADARLFEAQALMVDESSLTGESLPSSKVTRPVDPGAGVADQEDMVFGGTFVTHGKGNGVVVATGARSQVGSIASSLGQTAVQPTPLEVKFADLARQISVGAMILIVAVFILGLVRGVGVAQMLIIALSLTVASIPNALPMIVTVGLGFGARNLAGRRMLVKKLPAAESLGSVTVICTDKTGTLTKNQMTVTRLFFDDRVVSVSGVGYHPRGEFRVGKDIIDPWVFEPLVRVGCLCNASKIVHSGEDVEVIGDPTEAALLVLAKKAGFDEKAHAGRLVHVDELPFDPVRKAMSVLYKDTHSKKVQAFVKGAPESILPACTRIFEGGRVVPMTARRRSSILEHNGRFASDALRVIALAYRDLPLSSDHTAPDVEHSLIFVGLVGMMDPPRDGVARAVETCREAGIKVIMITGDQAVTARAVGKSIGLYRMGDRVLTGDEIDGMSDEDLAEVMGNVSIIARALPLQKSRVVDALQDGGHVVAMTGDGVNDAPALKRADLGIAMGVGGTDVAKEVAKAVLVDDHFATIVHGIEEGRNIYDKIIKSARYLLSCNVGEITTVLIALLVGLPVPLLPLQILLINVLTDQAPALGLGFESPESSIMRRMPRDPKKEPIDATMFLSILLFGLLMGIGTVFVFARLMDDSLVHARTVAFTVLVMFQMFAVISSRSLYFSWDKLNPLTNTWLSGSVVLSVLLQVMVIYWPPMQAVFGTVGLSMMDWVWVLGVSSLGFVLMEVSKVLLPGYEPVRNAGRKGV